jgi:D-aminopeptidase
VNGVKVGHVTLFEGEGDLVSGSGPVRTGVTVILPHGENLYQQKVRAAAVSLNGHSKVIGLEQVRELGVIETPIALTNTLNVGLVADGLLEYTFQHNRNAEVFTVNPVVGETNDHYLNDIWGRHVRQAHVLEAIETTKGGRVEEGAVGAGAGTSCFGWKGGIGTSSRVLPEYAGGYVVAALVQSNYGSSIDLRILGVPVGEHLQPPPEPEEDKTQGSIMMVLATDAPLDSRQLTRLCMRAGIGLGRTGSFYGNSSGDVVIAFSTAHRVPFRPEQIEGTYSFVEDENMVLGEFFHATADCVEEAIINSLFQAETVQGWGNHIRYALPVEEAVRIVKKAYETRD